IFKVQGMVYHFMYNLDQIEEGQLTHANQTWLISSGEAMNRRLEFRSALDGILMDLIKTYLTENNGCYRLYRDMYQVAERDQLTNYAIRFFQRQNDDLTYALPE